MKVLVFNKQKDLKVLKQPIKALARAVVSLEKKLYDEVSIHFVDNATMCKLHKEYFNDPTPTDCISFPIDNEEDGYKLMGDVVVCPLVAKTYARTKKLDVGEELSLYIVHGLLHLIGYDDIDSRDRKVMRSAERRHLKNLRAKKLCLKVFG